MRKLPKIELNNENRKSNANISLDIESIINNEINKNNVTNIKQSQKGVILDGNQKYNLRRNISYISRQQRYNTLDQKENNIANHMSYEDFIKKHETITEIAKQSEKLAERYKDGTALVFRLCVDNYHRYSYIESGIKSKNRFIEGVLHTVRPVALAERPVFTENCSSYTLIGKYLKQEAMR